MVPTPEIGIMLCTLLDAAGQYQQAIAAIDHLRERGVPGEEAAYAAAMHACGQAASWYSGQQLLQRMTTHHIAPTICVLAPLLRSLANASQLVETRALLPIIESLFASPPHRTASPRAPPWVPSPTSAAIARGASDTLPVAVFAAAPAVPRPVTAPSRDVQATAYEMPRHLLGASRVVCAATEHAALRAFAACALAPVAIAIDADGTCKYHAHVRGGEDASDERERELDESAGACVHACMCMCKLHPSHPLLLPLPAPPLPPHPIPPCSSPPFPRSPAPRLLPNPLHPHHLLLTAPSYRHRCCWGRARRRRRCGHARDRHWRSYAHDRRRWRHARRRRAVREVNFTCRACLWTRWRWPGCRHYRLLDGVNTRTSASERRQIILLPSESVGSSRPQAVWRWPARGNCSGPRGHQTRSTPMGMFNCLPHCPTRCHRRLIT